MTTKDLIVIGAYIIMVVVAIVFDKTSRKE